MCLLRDVLVIDPQLVLFKRNISRCQLPQYKKKEVDYIKDLLFSQQCTFSSPSQHSLQILSSLLPFTRNLPSTRRPNCCIVLWQQQICWLVLFPSHSIYWMSLVQEHWSLCRYAFDAAYITVRRGFDNSLAYVH